MLSGLNIVRPKKGVVASVISALVISGSVGYFIPSWGGIMWVISLATFLLIVPSISALNANFGFKSNGLIKWLLFFGLYSFASVIFNIDNYTESIAALKNTFQFWPIALLAFVGIIDDTTKKTIFITILFIAFLQIPVSIFQYFFVVDWGARLAGGDSVVGTFGGSIDGGGNSGALTTFLLIVWTFLISKYLSSKKYGFVTLLTSLSLFIPILLNETKIFFFYLPVIVMQLILAFFKRHKARTVILASVSGLSGLGILLFYFLFLQQSGIGMKDSTTLESYIDRRIENQSGLSIENSRDRGLSRLGSIIYWWNENSIDKKPIEMVFGNGLGASKSSGLFKGHLYDVYKYRNYKLDVTGISQLLWDVGLVGTVIYLSIYVVTYFSLSRTLRICKQRSPEAIYIIAAKISVFVLLIDNLYDTYQIKSQALNMVFVCIIAYALYVRRSTLITSRQEGV